MRPSARAAPARSAEPAVPRVVIAAGGTAGHVVPALAVADALRAEGAEVSLPRRRRPRRGRGWSPRPATRSTCCACAASTAPIPVRAAGALRLAAAAVPRRAGVLRARGAEAVLGGGGYVAGPAGLAALSLRPAAGADRGRPPPRAHQPAARPPRAAGLPRVPDRRAATGDRYLVTGRPVPAAVARGRPRRGPRAVRDRRRRPLPARLRRQPGRALDQPRRARGVRGPGRGAGATSTSSTSAAAATTPIVREALRAAPHPEPLHAARVRARTSPTRSPPPTSCSRAPAARSSRSPPPAGPAILVPYPHAAGAPPARQRRVDGATAGRRW